MVTPRQNVVPRHVQERTCWLGSTATMDEIELAAIVLPDGPAGAWARSVVDRAAIRASAGDPVSSDVLWAVDSGDELVQSVTVVASGDPGQIRLTAHDARSITRMLDEGAESVLVRPYAPVAIIRRRHDTSPITAAVSVPHGAVEVAIVDELDKTAVLDLLAVAPGPEVFRRHDGQWQPDPGWVAALRSVRPPPMVKLTGDDQLRTSVEQQVDEATRGQLYTPLTPKIPQGEAAPEPSVDDAAATNHPVAASAAVRRIVSDGDDFLVQMAITAAVDVGELRAPVATERLRQYWLHGKGAAKIRWGTPGAWTRCHRLLSKYMPPTMTPGYCTNLSQRLGGQGIATHVGDRRPGEGLLPG